MIDALSESTTGDDKRSSFSKGRAKGIEVQTSATSKGQADRVSFLDKDYISLHPGPHSFDGWIYLYVAWQAVFSVVDGNAEPDF